VWLGGTSRAYTVAQVVDDGDGSFVIEDAISTVCRCPKPSQLLFNRNQLNSCLFVHPFLECHYLDELLGMAKWHQALV
jgi:hypothetical protein